MHTEEEAKTKWCPFARVVVAHDSGPAFNRVTARNSGGDVPRGMCIAGQCMAWRWVDPEMETRVMEKGHAHRMRPKDPTTMNDYTLPPAGDGWTVKRDDTSVTVWERPWQKPRTGFCGLSEPRLAEERS